MGRAMRGKFGRGNPQGRDARRKAARFGRQQGSRRQFLRLPVITWLAVAAAMVGCSSPQPSDTRLTVSPEQLNYYILESSYRFNIPAEWIHAVMEAESGGRTHLNGRPITSHAGAMGLMQVMPGTYEELRREHDLGRNPYNPRDNILAGTAYLRKMYDLFGSPGFLAAYNAGPGRYSQHLTYGRPLPPETRRYVAVIYPRIAGIYPRGEYPDRSISEIPQAERPEPG